MKILVTGGAGFIGSNVADGYIARGHRVVIIDNLSGGNKRNINGAAKFYKMDIRDRGVMDIFKKEKIDIVSHHAAQVDVRKSVADPAFDAQVNIGGILNLLDAAVKYGTKKFIFASSGGVMYGEVGNKLPDEKTIPHPISPYGISKLSGEHYISFYGKVHGLKYTILRYGNVYGPRQDPCGEAGVVAIFAGRMLKGKPVNIFGDGRQMRDYIFVKDVVKANMLAANKADGETINIGTGRTTSVNALFKKMAALTCYSRRPVFREKREGELFRNGLDVKKAKRIMNWSAETEIEEGLRETLKFFGDKA